MRIETTRGLGRGAALAIPLLAAIQTVRVVYFGAQLFDDAKVVLACAAYLGLAGGICCTAVHLGKSLLAWTTKEPHSDQRRADGLLALARLQFVLAATYILAMVTPWLATEGVIRLGLWTLLPGSVFAANVVLLDGRLNELQEAHRPNPFPPERSTYRPAIESRPHVARRFGLGEGARTSSTEIRSMLWIVVTATFFSSLFGGVAYAIVAVVDDRGEDDRSLAEVGVAKWPTRCAVDDATEAAFSNLPEVYPEISKTMTDEMYNAFSTPGFVFGCPDGPPKTIDQWVVFTLDDADYPTAYLVANTDTKLPSAVVIPARLWPIVAPSLPSTRTFVGPIRAGLGRLLLAVPDDGSCSLIGVRDKVNGRADRAFAIPFPQSIQALRLAAELRAVPFAAGMQDGESNGSGWSRIDFYAVDGRRQPVDAPPLDSVDAGIESESCIDSFDSFKPVAEKREAKTVE